MIAGSGNSPFIDGFTPAPRLALPSPESPMEGDSMATIKNTVLAIKQDTTLLTKYQKDLLDALGLDINNLIGALGDEFKGTAGERERVRRESKERYTYQRKQDAENAKARQGYEEWLRKIYGANSQMASQLLKAYDVANKSNALLVAMKNDYLGSIKEMLEGDSTKARQGRREAIKAQTKAADKGAIGDFLVGMAEKTGSFGGNGIASWALQRFAGQSVKGRQEDRKYRAEDYQAQSLSNFFGGNADNYNKLNESIDLTKQAKFQARTNMLNAMKGAPSGGGYIQTGETTLKGLGSLSDTFTKSYGGSTGSKSQLSRAPMLAALPALAIIDTMERTFGPAGEKLHGKEKGEGGGSGSGIKAASLALAAFGADLLIAKGKLGALVTGIGTALSKIGPKIAKTLSKIGPKIAKKVGAIGKALGKLPEKLGGPIAKIASKIGGPLAKVGGAVVKKLPLIGAIVQAGITGKEVYDIQTNKDMSTKEKTKRTGGSIGAGLGSLGGAAGGALAGAAIGSVVPVIGTAVGGIVGAIAGGLIGDFAGKKAGEGVGGLIANAADKPKFHTGGVVNAVGSSEVDATLQRGEVVLPNNISSIYKQIADNTNISAMTVKKDVMTKLIEIADILNEISAKSSSGAFPGATATKQIGSK